MHRPFHHSIVQFPFFSPSLYQTQCRGFQIPMGRFRCYVLSLNSPTTNTTPQFDWSFPCLLSKGRPGYWDSVEIKIVLPLSHCSVVLLWPWIVWLHLSNIFFLIFFFFFYYFIYLSLVMSHTPFENNTLVDSSGKKKKLIIEGIRTIFLFIDFENDSILITLR